jgi:cytochrome c oxidase subunit 3
MTTRRITDPKEDNFFGTSIILYLILAAVTFLFLGVMGAYMYNRFTVDLPPLQVPNLFYFSTIIILLVSYACQLSLKAFDQGHFKKLHQMWILILVGLMVFGITQSIGWNQMIEAGYPASSNNSVGYMFALSALHLLHIAGGLPFHLKVNWRHYLLSKKDEFAEIEYLSEDSNRERLVLIIKYWHYLDILWLILMVFFGINALWG